MISNILRKLIEPHLKICLPEEDWVYIDDMFSECYRTFEHNEERITLKPTINGGEQALQFSSINGMWVDLVMWETIKKVGVKL